MLDSFRNDKMSNMSYAITLCDLPDNYLEDLFGY